MSVWSLASREGEAEFFIYYRTMLLAVAFLALLVREAKDKGSVRKGMWVFRLATKRSGSYITTNTKLVCGACT